MLAAASTNKNHHGRCLQSNTGDARNRQDQITTSTGISFSAKNCKCQMEHFATKQNTRTANTPQRKRRLLLLSIFIMLVVITDANLRFTLQYLFCLIGPSEWRCKGTRVRQRGRKRMRPPTSFSLIEATRADRSPITACLRQVVIGSGR